MTVEVDRYVVIENFAKALGVADTKKLPFRTICHAVVAAQALIFAERTGDAFGVTMHTRGLNNIIMSGIEKVATIDMVTGRPL